MRPMTRARRFRWIAAAAFLALATLAAGVWLRVAGSSTPADPVDALDDFRGETGGAAVAGSPAPGVYAYLASGSERGGLGPLAVSRDLPEQAVMVVTTSPVGWDAELRYSEEHIETSRYRVDVDGAVRTVWHRTKLTFGGFGRDDRRDVVPPSLTLPAAARPGMTWRERYRTGDINVVSRSRITRAERVRVGAATVETLVIAIDSTTDGPHPGTRDETIWWAPAMGLPVRWDVRMDIGGTFAFRATSSVRLRSTSPAT